MKKRKKGRKLGRKRDQRRALKRVLLVSLIKEERIKTTLAKAKELKPFAEKFITKAKRNDMNAHRFLQKHLPKKVTSKLIKEIAPRFENRPGGYLRIIKLPDRQSDGAKLAVIEFVSLKHDTKEKKQTKK